MDTIFALSSGAPPAGIAVLRISGSEAREALRALAGRIPEPRRASFAELRSGGGEVLDRGLVLWFPGPRTATGEDIAELHLHGGRAVIAVVMAALKALPGLRAAEPGEFTRRAFANGRIDLAEAEGLADLLSAETEMQRRAAMAMAGGAFSAQVEQWRDRVLLLSAEVEAVLDFSDEEDAGELLPEFARKAAALAGELGQWLDRPRAERLREGFRVALAGPPNSGKSTLFNALVEIEAAITSPLAGTTRDLIERPVAIAGIPFLFIDTAGLRDEEAGEIERIGIARARAELDRADLVLWLGPEGEGPPGAWEVETMIDVSGAPRKEAAMHRVSGVTGKGVNALRQALTEQACGKMPKPGEVAVNVRQAGLLAEARNALDEIESNPDLLVVAERLRLARTSFDALIGRASAEHMLDALFGRFCIGK